MAITLFTSSPDLARHVSLSDEADPLSIPGGSPSICQFHEIVTFKFLNRTIEAENEFQKK